VASEGIAFFSMILIDSDKDNSSIKIGLTKGKKLCYKLNTYKRLIYL
jgi:hypothetical protein